MLNLLTFHAMADAAQGVSGSFARFRVVMRVNEFTRGPPVFQLNADVGQIAPVSTGI